MVNKLSIDVKHRLLILCLVGFAAYGLLNILAMIFYPGGTVNNADRTGYAFLENFFSDLGMVKTYSGEPNTLSFYLFASALILVGFILILFFLLLSTYFPKPLMRVNLSKAGSIAGVVSGISCIGIALTPWDRFHLAHMLFAYCLSAFFLAVALLYSIAIFRNPSYPNGYAIVFIAYFGVLLVFVALMIFGPDLESVAGLTILAAGQKICIYSGMICIFIQVIGAYIFNQYRIDEQVA
jgi:hypothetical protein